MGEFSRKCFPILEFLKNWELLLKMTFSHTQWRCEHCSHHWLRHRTNGWTFGMVRRRKELTIHCFLTWSWQQGNRCLTGRCKRTTGILSWLNSSKTKPSKTGIKGGHLRTLVMVSHIRRVGSGRIYISVLYLLLNWLPSYHLNLEPKVRFSDH